MTLTRLIAAAVVLAALCAGQARAALIDLAALGLRAGGPVLSVDALDIVFTAPDFADAIGFTDPADPFAPVVGGLASGPFAPENVLLFVDGFDGGFEAQAVELAGSGEVFEGLFSVLGGFGNGPETGALFLAELFVPGGFPPAQIAAASFSAPFTTTGSLNLTAVAPVPLPAGGLLLVSALAGGVLLRRRG